MTTGNNVSKVTNCGEKQKFAIYSQTVRAKENQIGKPENRFLVSVKWGHGQHMAKLPCRVLVKSISNAHAQLSGDIG